MVPTGEADPELTGRESHARYPGSATMGLL